MILPILFNTEMVRALLEERKTVTRRVVKYTASDVYRSACFHGRWHEGMDVDNLPLSLINWYCKEVKRPPYEPGDILYVRETWGNYATYTNPDGADYFMYRADYPDGATSTIYPDGTIFNLPLWKPSIHMPKEAARIFLWVKSVRVERLQDITEEQAKAEGFYSGWKAKGAATPALTAKQAFMWFWPPDVWAANPRVWVIEFERIDKPEG